MPSAAKAALCIWGEREWPTGQPITPASRVPPPTGVLATMGEEVLVVVREVVAAVALGHVVEVVDVGGVRRGLQRCQTRVADRGGRQPVAHARVVRRVG